MDHKNLLEKKIVVRQKVWKNKVNAYKKYLEKIKSESYKYAEKVNDRISKELARELEYIVRTYVSAFYDDYMPSSYDRTGDLFNIYDTSKQYNIQIGPGFMQHHGSESEYIFEYSLVQGYHGSHVRKEFGVPWWKTPPEYKEWYTPAVRTTAYYPYMKQDLIRSIKRHQIKAQRLINEKNQELAQKAINKKNSINFYKRK